MTIPWTFFLHFGIISSALLLATLLRSRIFFFQKYLIPNSLTAGFMLLVFYNYFGPRFGLFGDDLGTFVYHLLNISFVAMSLRRSPQKGTLKRASSTAIGIISMFAVQSAIGLGIGAIFIVTFYPELFPSFGFLLPLGFAQGPGQAYSIGVSWEELGFLNGGNIGLSIATIGFLWAILFGIPLINILIRKKKAWGLEDREKLINLKSNDMEEKHTENIPRKMFIDSLTVQVILIGVVYLVTYFTLRGISFALAPLGEYGYTVAQLLWGFHFVIGTMFAIIVRIILNALRRKNWLHINYPDNYILQRISAGSFDFMIVSAIAALSLSTFKANWLPIILVTSIGGIFTIIYTVFLCRRIYTNYIIEHVAGLYGQFTGTITTSMALLREIDPDSESNVPENLVIGGAVALPLGIPLMFILGLAVTGYSAGKPVFYFYAMGIFTLYLAGVLTYLLLKNKRKRQQDNQQEQ